MPVDGPALDERSQRALADYRARQRPLRVAYTAAVVALIAVVLVIVKIAYNHGEISHATLSTAPSPAPSIPLGTPSAQLSEAWSNTDHTAIGQPYWGGTVITYSTHAVVGRDAVSGDVLWSYTRTDRTTCTAAQLGGVTIAVYRLHGNCDELTALASDTGERRWTRTLDENGHPIIGEPSFAVGQDTFMITTPQVIYALSPDGTAGEANGGLDRWVFAQDGCTINSAVLGSAGALISQTCRHPDCKGVKFCGAGTQLLLRDLIAGQDDDSSTNHGNPDQITWNLIGNADVPVSADGVVSAISADGASLVTFGADKGKKLATLPLAAAVDPAIATPQAVAADTAELVHVGGRTYAVRAGDKPDYLWQTRTAALPTVTTAAGTGTELAGASVAVPTADGIATLDPASGEVAGRFAVPAPGPDSRVWAYGSGFVVADEHTTVYR